VIHATCERADSMYLRRDSLRGIRMLQGISTNSYEVREYSIRTNASLPISMATMQELSVETHNIVKPILIVLQ
jgi:hypothetical protein